MILPYILKSISCINTILSDYESVWPEVWPQNKCRSQWPTFYGPVIFPYILKGIWCICIILMDYELVWPEIWPQNKYRSNWPTFLASAILPCILKSIWCINIILSDYASVWPKVWPKNKVMYISWSSDFALYLEEYFVYKHHTLWLWVSMTWSLTSK